VAISERRQFSPAADDKSAVGQIENLRCIWMRQPWARAEVGIAHTLPQNYSVRSV